MDTNLRKKVDQYIQLVYSQKSELNTIENLDERKVAACERLKWDVKDEEVKKIINLRDEDIQEKMFDHLISSNSLAFALLLADEHYLTELLHKLIKPLESSDDDKDDSDAFLKALNLKSKVSENADAVHERIKVRRISIFKGEREAYIAQQKMRVMRHEDRLKQKSA